MSYKWKPSASQRRAFVEKMKDPAEQAAYYARKEAKVAARRSKSRYDYNTAGGEYVPTEEQHDFCLHSWPENASPEQNEARNIVMYGFSCNEKVHHDHIHIINEMRRAK